MEKLSTTSEVEMLIISHLEKNDQRVINLIYEHYSYSLFNVIYRIVRNEEVAQDLFQEVLIKVWRKGHYYEKSKGSIYTWLVSICKNAAIDKTRSRAFKQAQKTDKADAVAEKVENSSVEDNQQQAHLREMIFQLEEKHKKLIELSYFQGYTHEEIAKKLDMPLGTVKTRIRAAILQLRKLIKS